MIIKFIQKLIELMMLCFVIETMQIITHICIRVTYATIVIITLLTANRENIKRTKKCERREEELNILRIKINILIVEIALKVSEAQTKKEYSTND